MNLHGIFYRLRKSANHSTPLVEVHISRENLLHNLHTYQETYPQLQFAPVLKSNAYGHGLVETAKVLDREKIAFMVVDSFYEARVLRAAGIRSPLLVIGYTRPEDIAHSSLKNTAFALVDIEQVRVLAQRADNSLNVHLKLETGMHRHGITKEELLEVISLLARHSFIRVTGLCTHLADADFAISSMTDTQREAWNGMVPTVLKAFPTISVRHFAATKGIRFGNEAGATVIRLGIGLYGLDMSPTDPLPLKPVLELHTIVSSVRNVPTGERVGYNGTFVAKRPTRVATIPIGYFEGIDRGLSNIGSMLIHGKVAPIAGRVSMNMTSLDVTDIPNLKVGDTVVAISKNLDAPNTVRVIAQQTGRSPYDVLVHVPPHLKQVVE